MLMVHSLGHNCLPHLHLKAGIQSETWRGQSIENLKGRAHRGTGAAGNTKVTKTGENIRFSCTWLCAIITSDAQFWVTQCRTTLHYGIRVAMFMMSHKRYSAELCRKLILFRGLVRRLKHSISLSLVIFLRRQSITVLSF